MNDQDLQFIKSAITDIESKLEVIKEQLRWDEIGFRFKDRFIIKSSYDGLISQIIDRHSFSVICVGADKELLSKVCGVLNNEAMKQLLKD